MILVVVAVIAVWLVGWIYTIPTIYRALLKNQLRELNKKSNRGYSDSKVELDPGDVVNSAVAATLAAMFWYFGLPFFISKWIRDHRKVEIDKEIERVEEDYQHAEQLKQTMKRARREIEANSIVSDSPPEPPWRGHERF